MTGGKGGVTANHDAMLAARLAYFLNLSGPVLTINTACSSGLVAAHQACVSLRNRECDIALAAGVTLVLNPFGLRGMNEAGMLSNDGRCRAFDTHANGIVPGEAVAVLVLKRLSRAQADGDPILAVIQGSGVNYDGKTNGITAPSGVSQTRLLTEVYRRYRNRSGNDRIRGDPRHRHQIGRSHRGQRPQRCLHGRSAKFRSTPDTRLLRSDLRKDKFWPHLCCLGAGQPDQPGAGHAPRDDSRQSALRTGKRVHCLA